MKKGAVLFIFCLLISLIGCDSGEETVVSQQSTPVPVPTNTAVTSTPIPTATQLPATPTVIPPSQTPTATATPSPTATPNFICPQPGGNATLEKSADFPEFSENLATYLNQVGTIEQLPEQLDALNIEHEIFPVDMNNDNILELVLNVTVPSEEAYPYGDHGTVVLQCRDGGYRVILNTWWGYYHFFDYTFSDDINSDGNKDVIIVSGFAGSACHLFPVILIWDDWQIIDTTSEVGLRLGCSSQDKILLEDIDNDGNKELMLSGFTISHLDYGPPRIITQTLTLQSQAYQLESTEFGPPEYLIHLLDDAQRALDSGELDLAAQLYENVAHNQTLPTVSSYNLPSPQMAEEWGVEPDHPQEYQKAFALFRLAALQTVLGNTAETDWVLVQLQERFPEGTPGSELASLASLLVDSLQQSNSPEASCEIVLQEIEQSYPQLAAHYYWGFDIAWYRNETICPFAAP